MSVGDFNKIKAASKSAKYYLEDLESRLKSMGVDVVYKPLEKVLEGARFLDFIFPGVNNVSSISLF